MVTWITSVPLLEAIALPPAPLLQTHRGEEERVRPDQLLAAAPHGPSCRLRPGPAWPSRRRAQTAARLTSLPGPQYPTIPRCRPPSAQARGARGPPRSLTAGGLSACACARPRPPPGTRGDGACAGWHHPPQPNPTQPTPPHSGGGGEKQRSASARGKSLACAERGGGAAVGCGRERREVAAARFSPQALRGLRDAKVGGED